MNILDTTGGDYWCSLCGQFIGPNQHQLITGSGDACWPLAVACHDCIEKFDLATSTTVEDRENQEAWT